jgi:Skp family chaperone for outer membrane proteins
MKTTFPRLACAALFLAVSASAADQPVAVVDMERLVRLHPNTASDKKLLEQTLKDFTEQKDALQRDAEATRKAYEAAVKEAQNPALSDKARQRQEEDAQRKREAALKAERDYAETVRSLQRQLAEQELRMLRRTRDAIAESVAAVARERRLSLVLELPGRKLGNASGVAYSEPSLDITAAVMQRLGIQPGAMPEDDDEPAAARSATNARPAAASGGARP